MNDIKQMQEDQDIKELFGMDKDEMIHIRLRALLRIIGRALQPKEQQIKSLAGDIDRLEEEIYDLKQQIVELEDNHEVQQDLDQE